MIPEFRFGGVVTVVGFLETEAGGWTALQRVGVEAVARSIADSKGEMEGTK
jgi:hypothetical protein